MSESAYKWLPVVGGDCTGCGLCVHACDNQCLGLEWDFATLHGPQHCVSDGKCATACPRDVIQMQWVKTSAHNTVGRWRDQPEESTERRESWLSRLIGDR